MPKKAAGENSKKAAGNAKKAEVAAQKQASKDADDERKEAKKWDQGSKDNSKKDAAADKAAEAARKKAEKAALLADEEASQPSKPKTTKSAQKKTAAPARGPALDLSALDSSAPSSKQAALNATGIDNALDALSLTNTTGQGDKIDRHPERRFKAAYSAYEERRLDEMKDEKGLRRQQKIDQIRKEFEKSPENPFNQVTAGRFDMSRDEMQEMKQANRDAAETRLTGQ